MKRKPITQSTKFNLHKKTAITQQLTKNSIEAKFFQLQQKNPRLKNLINKFSTDPQRKLNSVIMTSNKINDIAVKKSGNGRKRITGANKSTMLPNRRENSKVKVKKNRRNEFKSLFNTGMINGETEKNKEKKKKNFIKNNKANAFDPKRNNAFFESRMFDFKKRVNNKV